MMSMRASGAVLLAALLLPALSVAGERPGRAFAQCVAAREEPMTVVAACGAAIRLEAGDRGRVAVAYLVRGLGHNALGEPDEALADMTRAIELAPSFAPAYAARGELLAHRREYEKALADLNEALRFDPADAETWHQRGDVNDILGRGDAAIADYGEAIRRNPRADYYIDRGAAFDKRRDRERAMADYDRALRLEPDNARAHSSRGRMRFERGEFADAVPDLMKAADLDPDAPYYAIWLYLARARAGETDAAAELERRAAAFNPEAWPVPVIAMLLGRRDPDAILPMPGGDALRRRELLCEANFYIGQFHLLRGEAEKAKAAFAAAVATGATEPVTYQKAEAELRRLGG
jgi:lipoprotein NlpI